MTAYYNEIDPYAAQWLRNLIAAREIAPGDVDERDIRDVKPDELVRYTQCHFFAGIGVWSLALRKSGWPDDRPAWTGSCPCPPFSAAGKGTECPSCGGRACLSHPLVTAGWLCLDCGDEWRGDDRHLLPEFMRLIGQCRPATVFGEQVASKDGRAWLYTLRAVMERMGFAVGAADLCAAGVGAPNIRQRLFFAADNRGSVGGMGDAFQSRLEGHGGNGDSAAGRAIEAGSTAQASGIDGLAGAASVGCNSGSGLRGSGSSGFGGVQPAGSSSVERVADSDRNRRNETRRDQSKAGNDGAVGDGSAGGVANSIGIRQHAGRGGNNGEHDGSKPGAAIEDGIVVDAGCPDQHPRPTNGFWADADWLSCRDNTFRPVEPGTSPLADGVANRVGKLRAYGNAINAETAKVFIEAVMEAAV